MERRHQLTTEPAATVWLVRHADVHNPADLVYGRLPRFRLSALGHRQAKLLADYLATAPVAALYASPLLRAQQTAAILAARRPAMPVRTSRLLVEVGHSWQGEPMAMLGAEYNVYEPPRSSADETIAGIFARMDRFIRQVRRRHPGALVLAVSHADPIMIVRTGYEELPLRFASIRRMELYPAKGSITALRFADGAARPEISYVIPPGLNDG
ncbi:MAG: histidine phosphatase family protein [Chloroflexi bacterium]|nr:histidine phosphatase family protein [Chloroflexota bacterium]